MSDLPTPINRNEQYLNAIANGDPSDLPNPITREEQYLDYIARNGGGSGGDGVSSFNGRTGAVVPKSGDYTAEQVGALPSDTLIPSKTSDLDNDSGFVPADSALSTTSENALQNKVITSNILAMNVTGAKNLFDFDGYLKTANPASGYTKNGNSYTVNDFSELHNVTAYQFSEDDIDGIFTVILSTTESSNAPQPAFWIYDKNGNLVSSENIPERLPTNTPYEWSQSFNGGCKIVVKQYAGAGHLTFTSPMIRPAGTDPTYVPFAMTNRELTENIETVFNNLVKPERASVSVLEYAATLSDGIYFYSTTVNATDNPANASFMYIIFSASTGRTILAIGLAVREMYMNATANSGQTWSGWKAISIV